MSEIEAVRKEMERKRNQKRNFTPTTPEQNLSVKKKPQKKPVTENHNFFNPKKYSNWLV